MANRVTQVATEALYQPTDLEVRSTQVIAEALYQPTDLEARVSQVVLEALVSAAEAVTARPRFWATIIG